MTPETEDQAHDGDLFIELLSREVRELRDNIRKERQQKDEVIARYESVITEKHHLQTKVALLEAECARLKRQKLQAEVYPESSFLVIP